MRNAEFRSGELFDFASGAAKHLLRFPDATDAPTLSAPIIFSPSITIYKGTHVLVLNLLRHMFLQDSHGLSSFLSYNYST
jgi:hypothetical protein